MTRLLACVGLVLLAACGRPPDASTPTPTPQAKPVFVKLERAKQPPVIYGTAVSFEESGLEPNHPITYRVAGDAVLTYSCGGTSQKLATPISSTTEIKSDGSGRAIGVISLEMTPPTCPDGSRIRPQTFELSGVRLTDTTHGITTDLPGRMNGVFD